MESLIVREITAEDAETARNFLFEMVETLFEAPRNPVYHRDIFELETFYLEDEKQVLIGAFNPHGQLVGTIGLKRFVDRFKSIENRYDMPVAEVGRCYIDPNKRRIGVGGKLLKEAVKIGRQMGYEILYLHTHPNLPGGYEFWLKSGFETIAVDSGKPDIIHMEYRL